VSEHLNCLRRLVTVPGQFAEEIHTILADRTADARVFLEHRQRFVEDALLDDLAEVGGRRAALRKPKRASLHAIDRPEQVHRRGRLVAR
jgi:hypothetical protein